jgi:hypothetical protein
MKKFQADSFLTKGSVPLPGGKWRGVAIHPSSEVDMAVVDGMMLTVGGVVPLAPNTTVRAEAVRYGLPTYGIIDAARHRAADGRHVVGERLVLALYEDCDALVPLGARASSFCAWRVSEDELGTENSAEYLPFAEASAQLIFRVPMQGRTRCALAFSRDETLDMTIHVYGRRAGSRQHRTASPDTNFGMLAASSEGVVTWFDGGVPPTAPQA